MRPRSRIQTTGPDNGYQLRDYSKSSNRSENRPLIYTNDAHKPAHAHVTGKGSEVRVGPNGKPLKGQPELSTQQKRVVDNHKKALRKEVKAIGKENKKLEENGKNY